MSWFVVILVVVAVFLVVGLLMKLFAGMAHMFISFGLFILVIAGGIWITMDMKDMRENFNTGNKLFLLDIDDEVRGAFVLGESGEPQVNPFIDEIKNNYPDLEKIQGDNYKVIVLSWSFVADDLEMESFSATEEEIFDALISENPKQLFIDKGIAQYGEAALGSVKLQADTSYPTRDSFRSSVFALLAEKPLNDQQELIAGIKEKTVKVYPETAMFKIMKILPTSISKTLLQKEE